MVLSILSVSNFDFKKFSDKQCAGVKQMTCMQLNVLLRHSRTKENRPNPVNLG